MIDPGDDKMDSNLNNFISQMRAAGKTDEEIRSSLKSVGWEDSDISTALSNQGVTPPPRSISKSPVFLGVLVVGMLTITAGFAFVAFTNRKSDKIQPNYASNRADSDSTYSIDPTLSSEEHLEDVWYESSDIGNASTVKIRLPKGWYADEWGSITDLIVVMKPKGYTIKEFSYPFVDINVVQVGTKSVGVISGDNDALFDKWITNNDVLPAKDDDRYSMNLISREFRKFNTGYGPSNAYYVEFDLFLNKPNDTKDGPAKNLKFARILVEAKNPNFAFDIKIVDTLENWNRDINIIYGSLATLTGRGAVEENIGI